MTFPGCGSRKSKHNCIIKNGITRESKRVIAKITALFSLDAFGGGFLTDAIVAYWFFRRFGIVFFAVHILNACSHVGTVWLARQIGLINAMVFTYLPSSLFPTSLCRLRLHSSGLLCFSSAVKRWSKWTFPHGSPNERTFAAGINKCRPQCSLGRWCRCGWSAHADAFSGAVAIRRNGKDNL